MKKLQVIAVLAVGVGAFLTFLALQKRTSGTPKASQYGTAYDDDITGNQSKDAVIYV